MFFLLRAGERVRAATARRLVPAVRQFPLPRRGRAVYVDPAVNTRWLAGTPAQTRKRRQRLAAFMNGGAELIAGTDAGIPGVPHGAYADELIALGFFQGGPRARSRRRLGRLSRAPAYTTVS
jgi:hypothetical protein